MLLYSEFVLTRAILIQLKKFSRVVVNCLALAVGIQIFSKNYLMMKNKFLQC